MHTIPRSIVIGMWLGSLGMIGCESIDSIEGNDVGNADLDVQGVTTGHASNNLVPDGTLTANQYLQSSDGSHRLYLQGDGNLVLRRMSDQKALWSSGTSGKSATRFVFQRDGNLVLYTASQAGVWSSNTVGSGATELHLHSAGQLVLYRNTTAVWSTNGAPADECPNDPNKTKPGLCGCGVAEGTCGTGKITHVGTTKVWDSNGQNMVIARPSGSATGDLLVLFLHRTDNYLPLSVSGWTRVAECYKRDNAYDCSTAADCTNWNGAYCEKFGSYGQRGHDLAQAVFYRVVGGSEQSSYSFSFKNKVEDGKEIADPSWAILTALRGAATSNPVRDWDNEGNDGNSDSLFPSVYGQNGDMLLLSESFDDAIAQSKFGAPDGMSTFGYVSQSDEAGFLFGGILNATGETGSKKTNGDGGPGDKDALVSLTIKPK